jgi:acetyl esterase/lipase
MPTDTTFPVSIVSDIQFATAAGVPLFADLHLPQGAGTAVPAIVWVHGGGWRFGDRRLAPDLSRYFAMHGFAMVAVDYRLSDEAIFPAPIEDLKTAIRWLRSVAREYGLDASRLGLFGSSAGGHLSALAALTAPGVFEPADAPYAGHSSRVLAVVDGYGPTDFLQIDAHRLPDGFVSDDPETLLLPRGMTRSMAPDSFESLLLGAAIGTCPDRVRDANPLSYVTPGCPPFLLLHGSSDTTLPLHQSELLYDALAAADNDVTLCVIAQLGHGFLSRSHLDDGPAREMTVKMHLPGRGDVTERRREPIFPMIEAFFRKHLMSTASDDSLNAVTR